MRDTLAFNLTQIHRKPNQSGVSLGTLGNDDVMQTRRIQTRSRFDANPPPPPPPRRPMDMGPEKTASLAAGRVTVISSSTTQRKGAPQPVPVLPRDGSAMLMMGLAPRSWKDWGGRAPRLSLSRIPMLACLSARCACFACQCLVACPVRSGFWIRQSFPLPFATPGAKLITHFLAFKKKF